MHVMVLLFGFCIGWLYDWYCKKVYVVGLCLWFEGGFECFCMSCYVVCVLLCLV